VTAALELLARCRELGIVLAAGPDGLVWEADFDPPDELLADLAAAKVALLPLLLPAWDHRAEADGLVAQAQARRREVYGPTMWPSDPAARQRLSGLAGAIDEAWTARDMPQLRKAIAAYLDAVGGVGVRRAEALDASAATPAGRSGGLFHESPAGPYNERS
jgi:hypothetical protein